jgi:hypothetical protein
MGKYALKNVTIIFFCNQHYESVIEMFQIPKYLSSALHQCVFVLPTAAAVLSMGQKQTRPPKGNVHKGCPILG